MKVRFDWKTIAEEEERLEKALEIGGYRVDSRVQLFSIYALVDEAVVSDFHEIAMDLNTHDYEIDHEPTFDEALNEPALIATRFFERREDVERFQRRLKRVGFRPVEDDPLFD